MPLQPIPDLGPATLGFRASGTITADDYKNVLDPAIKNAVDHEEPIRLLFVLGKDYQGYSLGALWQDLQLVKVPRDMWSRIAVVTDNKGITEAIHLFHFALPAEVRVFPVDDEADAVAWLN
ncbi:STAS/SEC14 domain-containing protein [Nocardia camponoti]|uniref:STAS/SEC14 domain-containing protein n=1 Tax=Nocardia camponoti TaxID=1616106 RepID=A0A917V6J4_9NOCA|nr:STAS/SEC14 domain-containing protein [Nocardia camponoti]GGK44124.1 hypothetical protein GCM10011591_14570 [Nocardia camponoti]